MRIKDSGPAAWRARIVGWKAMRQCPKTSVVAIYAGTEELLREALEVWLGSDTESGEEDSEPRVEPEDCASTPRAGTEWFEDC